VVRIETRADAKRQYKAAYELPQEIDVTASAAKLENGVLTLTLAKQVPVSTVTQLNISNHPLAVDFGQRPAGLDVESVGLAGRLHLRLQPHRAAMAIMAPLSVHRCSSG
jgi:hypothetical protein